MTMEPYYGYGNYAAADAAANGVAGFLMVFMILYYLLTAGFFILNYVLTALSTYTIAKRRGIHHPWLAWLPIGSEWILGSISDQYQYLTKKRVRNRRKVLVGLSIGLVAAIVPIFAMIVLTAVSEVTGLDTEGTLLGATLAVTLLSVLVIAVLTIILAVFAWIALYDLYASSDPENAVLYLVLSILLGVTLPFFVFACRNKDLGMPPRKKPQPAVLVEAMLQEPAEEVTDASVETEEE